MEALSSHTHFGLQIFNKSYFFQHLDSPFLRPECLLSFSAQLGSAKIALALPLRVILFKNSLAQGLVIVEYLLVF
jgi:hypothetical protein